MILFPLLFPVFFENFRGGQKSFWGGASPVADSQDITGLSQLSTNLP